MNSSEFGGSGGGELFPEAGSFLSKNDDAGGASCCSFAIAGCAPCCLSDLRKINEPFEIFAKYLSEPEGVFTPGFLARLIGAVSAMSASMPRNLQAGALS